MQEEGQILAIYGNGRGKSAAAMGKAIAFAAEAKTAVIIQFLKGQYQEDFMSRLEPEIKLFRFERSEKAFSLLTAEEQEEEKANIVNGLLFARKVLNTDEANLLILDEVFGTIDEGLITEKELCDLIALKNTDQTIIMTGTCLPEKVKDSCDLIMNISKEK